MSTKKEIINKINRIDDPKLLKELDKWISSLLEASAGEEFTKEEIRTVHEGYSQYKAGKSINQDEANRIFNEWLTEK